MPVAWIIEEFPELDSTQNLLKQRAEEGAAEGLVIQAARQSQGRGRHGREWVSAPGNLMISVLLRPKARLKDVGQVGLLAGLAAAQAIGRVAAPPDLMIKWPNDILAGGRKCAGILPEAEPGPDGGIGYICLGFGINIASAPPEGAALGDVSKKNPDIVALRGAVLEALSEAYEFWLEGGFARIREEWLALAHPKGTHIRVKTGAKTVQGAFAGLDDAGNLLLQDEVVGVIRIAAGEVYL